MHGGALGKELGEVRWSKHSTARFCTPLHQLAGEACLWAPGHCRCGPCSAAPPEDAASSCCFQPAQVYRVLKPGGTFVFIQRLRGGALQGLLGGGSGLGAPFHHECWRLAKPMSCSRDLLAGWRCCRPCC